MLSKFSQRFFSASLLQKPSSILEFFYQLFGFEKGFDQNVAVFDVFFIQINGIFIAVN
jgi:hypothetical protein